MPMWRNSYPSFQRYSGQRARPSGEPFMQQVFWVIFIVIFCRFAMPFGGVELYILCAMGIGKFVAETKKLVASILGRPLF